MDNFYRDLPALNLTPEQALVHRQHFHLLPSDWQVIVADIKDSTHAFARGQYPQINLLAASCVIAALNLARQKNRDIPFIYGGDGASLVAPPSLAPTILEALAGISRLAKNFFKLELRVGAISISELEQRDHLVKVAKVRMAAGYNQAFFLDDGLAYAETLIKDDPRYQVAGGGGEPHPDLAGLQCRWSPIAGPAGGPNIMCLIVWALDPTRHDTVYQAALHEIEKIYGDFATRHPLRHHRLGYHLNWSQFGWESYALFGRWRLGYVLGLAVQTAWHKLFPPAAEREGWLAACDIIKTDGCLKTVIAGRPAQHEALLAYLKNRELAGELKFGHALVTSSFVTCFVPQASEQINFLDGTGGGYIRAASELKKKLAK